MFQELQAVRNKRPGLPLRKHGCIAYQIFKSKYSYFSRLLTSHALNSSLWDDAFRITTTLLHPRPRYVCLHSSAAGRMHQSLQNTAAPLPHWTILEFRFRPTSSRTNMRKCCKKLCVKYHHHEPCSDYPESRKLKINTSPNVQYKRLILPTNKACIFNATRVVHQQTPHRTSKPFTS